MAKLFLTFILRSRAWVALLLPLLCAGPATATHLVGGEMDLLHRTGDTYTLTLTLYFDAINGAANALDTVLTAGIYDKATDRLFANVRLPLTSDTFVSYTNPACTTGGLSTRKLIYAKNIRLSPFLYDGASGYYAAVERCCRNSTITNIDLPSAAAQTFYLEFPPVTRNGQPFIDSTPRIFPALGDYACRGQLFYYDFGGTDPDGDSLAYDLVTPLNGHADVLTPAPLPAPAPYAPITWGPGRSLTNQIPGSPALGINARTGRLTVRPSAIGLYVFGVRCAEYRRGLKIGETRRDFQLYVLNCPTNQPPATTIRTAAGFYQPGRDTLRLTPTTRCLTLRYTDPDPNSGLTLRVEPVNFTTPAPAFTTSASGTVRTPGQPDTLVATLCFPTCADTQGRVYKLNVIVADNGCSLPQHDTLRVAFTVTSRTPNAPVLTTTFPPTPAPADTAVVQVPLGQPYTATLLGTDADGDPLALTAAGAGFDLAAAGMRFGSQNGPGRATGTFAWQPICGLATTRPGGLLVDFILAESGGCVPQSRRRTVRFKAALPADSLAHLPPNIITPNGDGLNEAFALAKVLPTDFCDGLFAGVRIFSRWGQLVYQSSERTFRWSGAGVAGIYYYLVTYTDGRKYKGWLEVRP